MWQDPRRAARVHGAATVRRLASVRAQDARARRHHTRRLLPLGGHRLPRLRPDPTLTLTPKTDLGRVADDPAV